MLTKAWSRNLYENALITKTISKLNRDATEETWCS
jgi:hypothetical protein